MKIKNSGIIVLFDKDTNEYCLMKESKRVYKILFINSPKLHYYVSIVMLLDDFYYHELVTRKKENSFKNLEEFICVDNFKIVDYTSYLFSKDFKKFMEDLKEAIKDYRFQNFFKQNHSNQFYESIKTFLYQYEKEVIL